MPIQEETVYSALKQVRDPELMVNVVDLGLIYGVAVEEAGEKTNLGVMMTMTTPACPYGPQLVADVRDALMALDGAGECEGRESRSLRPASVRSKTITRGRHDVRC